MRGGILKRRLIYFVLLSVLDLLLTTWLLRAGGGQVYEANPLAAWWLGRFGWAGLAAFKAAAVLFAVAAFAALHWYRPDAARRVMTLTCAALALVVLYSASLAVAMNPAAGGLEGRELMAKAALHEELCARLETVKAFRRLRCRLSREVIGGRRTLAEAVARLQQEELTRDPTWLRQTRYRNPGRSLPEILQSQLLAQIREDLGEDVRSLQNPSAAEARLGGLPPFSLLADGVRSNSNLSDGAGRAEGESHDSKDQKRGRR
jgi:hypothetical protein